MEKRATMAKWSKQLVMRGDLVHEDLTEATKLPTFEAVEETHRSNNGERSRSTSQMQAKTLRRANTWSGMVYAVKSVPTEQELEVLRRSSDRVGVVMYWIIHDLAAVSKDLNTPPPIQSRMYQELSNGLLGFNQCMKVADVPFPFPYAQLLGLILVFFAIFIPVYVVCFTQNWVIGPVMSFLIFQGIWGINETAKELENPFGADANDISVEDFHYRFLEVCQEVANAHQVKVKRNSACSQ